MPYRVVKFQETPNPNALKCVLDSTLGEQPRSYFNAAAACDDPLAAALFALPGVTNVLINGTWITVNKSQDAVWKTIKPGVERVLGATP